MIELTGKEFHSICYENVLRSFDLPVEYIILDIILNPVKLIQSCRYQNGWLPVKNLNYQTLTLLSALS